MAKRVIVDAWSDTVSETVSEASEPAPAKKTRAAPKPKPKALKAPKEPKAAKEPKEPKEPKAPKEPAPAKKKVVKKKATAVAKSFCCGKGSRNVTFSGVRSELKKQYTIFKKDTKSKTISHSELLRHTLSFASYLSSVFSPENESGTMNTINSNLISFMRRRKITGFDEQYLGSGPYEDVIYQQRALVETVANTFLAGEQTIEAWAQLSLAARKVIK